MTTPTSNEPVRWLTNARLIDGRIIDIGVTDGVISEIVSTDETGRKPASNGEARPVLDLDGWLVLPAMVEPHAHLDKALTADLIPNPAGDLLGAIQGWIAAAGAGVITHDGIVDRAVQAIDKLVVHGVTAIRSHVNVMPSTGGAAVRALREASQHFDGVIDLQIVALCGSPMTGADGAPVRAALVDAIEAGIDLVGGCPHLDDNPQRLITTVIDAATDAGLGIDLHVDEMLDPSVLTLRDFARQIIDSGFEGSVAASHCVTLGMQPADVQAAVASEVAEAGIAVFPLPQTNLFLQGREHRTATPRGLTAVRALQEAGALVAAGGDNVQDPFNLVGRSDPLETAGLMVMAGHQSPEDAYDMVANNARRALGLAPVTFEVGDPADLVAIDAPSLRGAIADAPMSRRTIRHGTLIASATEQTTVHR